MHATRSILLAAMAGVALLADGVAVTNSTREHWQLRKNPAYGPGHYFAYPEQPGDAASRAFIWDKVPDWMDIDWPASAARRDLLIEPGATIRIDLVGNGDQQEGFHLLDGSGRQRGGLAVSRRPPEHGRPSPTELFFLPRAAPRSELALTTVWFEQDGRRLEILDRRTDPPAGQSQAPARTPPLRLGGVGSAFRSVQPGESKRLG